MRELRTVVADYESLDPQAALATFIEEAALVSDQDMYNRTAADTEKATLITLHAAKGLEFPDRLHRRRGREYLAAYPRAGERQ